MATNPFETAAGTALRSHRDAIAAHHLRDLVDDEERVRAMTLPVGPLTVDLSRMRGDVQTLDLLGRLADELHVPERLAAMVDGQVVNVTEQRPALHTALRTPRGESVLVDGIDVMPEVLSTQGRVSDFVEAVLSGRHRGATGERITDAVVIGIGGSDLGPRMVTAATRVHHTGDVRVHFVANVDPAELDAVLPPSRPRRHSSWSSPRRSPPSRRLPTRARHALGC